MTFPPFGLADRIREGIAGDLFPAQPHAAAELLGRLIRLDASVHERSDDSDGVIGDPIADPGPRRQPLDERSGLALNLTLPLHRAVAVDNADRSLGE
jgi:hypothetical protein